MGKEIQVKHPTVEDFRAFDTADLSALQEAAAHLETKVGFKTLHEVVISDSAFNTRATLTVAREALEEHNWHVGLLLVRRGDWKKALQADPEGKETRAGLAIRYCDDLEPGKGFLVPHPHQPLLESLQG